MLPWSSQRETESCFCLDPRGAFWITGAGLFFSWFVSSWPQATFVPSALTGCHAYCSKLFLPTSSPRNLSGSSCCQPCFPAWHLYLAQVHQAICSLDFLPESRASPPIPAQTPNKVLCCSAPSLLGGPHSGQSASLLVLRGVWCSETTLPGNVLNLMEVLGGGPSQ